MSDNFLQSPQWIEFQQSLGRKAWLFKNGGISGLVIKYDLPFGKCYLYCPYGPLTKKTSVDRKALESFLEEIKKIAIQEKAVFFRCDPRQELFLEESGFKKAPINYFLSAVAMPQNLAVLSLAGDEVALRNKLKPKTRYNIDLALKKGIEVDRKSGDLRAFYDLMRQTANRQQIRLHSLEHYRGLLDVFKNDLLILTARYETKPIATIMVLFFGDTATYLHGGTDYNYRQLMAPHLLHWLAIQEAKKRGCSFYDFGGVESESTQAWSGITRFKLSFGAEVVSLPGAYDLVFQPGWYALYNFFRGLRKKR